MSEINNSLNNSNMLNNSNSSNIMNRFEELSNQYKNFSVGNYDKEDVNFDSRLLNFKYDDINETISKMNDEMKLFQNDIDNLKSEYNKYVNFDKLCTDYVDAHNKELEIIKNIKIDMITSVLDFDIKLFEDDNKLFNSLVSLHNKCKNKMNDINYKISNKVNKINNFKKLICNSLDEEQTKKIADNYLCQICFTNKINVCLTPCGHTYCGDCSTKMKDCATCRSKITTKVKMFIDHVKDDNNDDKNNNMLTNNQSLTGGAPSNGNISGFTSFNGFNGSEFSSIGILNALSGIGGIAYSN